MISADLIKIFNGNIRWNATEMSAHEVALISSGLALTKTENEKFIGDLGDIARHTLKDASGIDLILLTKGSFYMRGFKFTKDLYAAVHAQCVTKYNLRELNQ